MYFVDIHLSRIYAGVPGTITFFCWTIGLIFQSATIGWIGVGFGLLALVFSIIQPSFLTPTWLKWLEREHGDILGLLKEEAHKMGLRTWDKRVQTQQALEEWVAEVRQKHGL